MYSLLHQLESEQKRTAARTEDDDWLDGVRTGQQAEKRLLIDRLHWLIDPHSKAVDLRVSGPLVARLNEQYKDSYSDKDKHPRRGDDS